MDESAPAWGTPDAKPTSTEYVVIGFYEANRERIFWKVTAATAREAEDRLVSELAAKEGIPRVCGVLALDEDGTIRQADTYATFLDPDEK